MSTTIVSVLFAPTALPPRDPRADPVAGAGIHADALLPRPLAPPPPPPRGGGPSPRGSPPPGRPPPGTATAPAPRLPGQGWPPRWASTSRGKALRALRA